MTNNKNEKFESLLNAARKVVSEANLFHDRHPEAEKVVVENGLYDEQWYSAFYELRDCIDAIDAAKEQS